MPNKSVFDNKDFQIYLDKGIPIVKVNIERITMQEAKEFRLVFATLFATQQYKIIIDFRNCIFIDSTIIGILVSTSKEIKKKEGDIFAITSPGKMRLIFGQMHLEKIIKQFNTIEKALENFPV